MKSARRAFLSGILLVLLAIGAVTFIPFLRQRVLFLLGSVLVNSEVPQKADAIEVLGGDQHGDRILLAAKLATEGYAPKVIVTGVAGVYGRWEPDLEIEYAVQRGYDARLFIPVYQRVLSTVEEARKAALPELRQLGVHKYLLVTSEFHTARAGRIYRREAPDLEVHVVAADTPHWRKGFWWTDREGRKIWLVEVTKTVADWFRI